MIYAVIGLGYVGLGLATALSRENKVFGYDINEARIKQLCNHVDENNQVSANELSKSPVIYTSCYDDIKSANFYIVTVPTPAYFYETPDLSPLIAAVEQLSLIVKKGDTIVFESTVYPGATDEVCIPILEKQSGLICGQDLYVGYSPERINPGDSEHVLKNITKVVSAADDASLKIIQQAYESICDKVYPVSSIKVAEAIKILENTQRDVNIALMNEFSKIMHALDLDVNEILAGALTKWSFKDYKPGFVGGHCISIDPHYLAFKAKRCGVQPDLILTARKINDGMPQFVIQSMIKILLKNKVNTNQLSIGVFGISYKENTNDIRNSLALKLIKELKEYGFNCHVHDPMEHDAKLNLKLSLESFDKMENLSVAIIVAQHDFYKDLGLNKILNKCLNPKIIMDIPNLFIKEQKQFEDIIYWNL